VATGLDADGSREPTAVLYQALEPPLIGGIVKPMKPGGYSDSGADIAFNLREVGVPVVLPHREADPASDLDWVFPDTAEGIQESLRRGATTLWANTILFHEHPLTHVPGDVRIVGQPPSAVERFDDKRYTNRVLASRGCPVPRAVLVGAAGDQEDVLSADSLGEEALRAHGLQLPLVVKPVRGRGSEAVTIVHTLRHLRERVAEVLAATDSVGGRPLPKYGDRVIVEEYLPREELTLTVMPPGTYLIDGAAVQRSGHWALPPVRRFNHVDGIAPYSGTVAVVDNSAVLSDAQRTDPAVVRLQEHCTVAAAAVEATAPIRVDCRVGTDGTSRLFDLNMKPNMTGPGRPCRDDQDSLTAIAARAIGWTYQDLLLNMLGNARTSGELHPASLSR
jgi:D-alanine-D-alanine ligase-like ATP-grasp enzyme